MERKEKPYIPVIEKWLHKYEIWKARLIYLDEKRDQEPSITSQASGLPSGSGNVSDTTQTLALGRIEASSEYYDISEKVRIMELAFSALKADVMNFVRQRYFCGISKINPWESLAMSKKTFYRMRDKAVEAVYYVGKEKVDSEIRIREKKRGIKEEKNGPKSTENPVKMIV